MLRQVVKPLVVVALLATTPAAAQEPVAGSSPKSGATAIGISLIATVVPTALGFAADHGSARPWLLLYGLYLGPSTGYFYVGRPWRVVGGGMVRFGISVATAAGIATSCGGDWLWGCEDEGAANAVAFIGLSAYAASAIYDIATVGSAVTKWNAERQPPRFSVTPQIHPTQRSGGVAVQVRF
jgi:hypothetical protein